jgi:signal peptidase I
MKKDLRATWSQALWTFSAPVLLVILVRWILFEPFVIPSGSMIPTLLVHDHIFVNKMAFGVRNPFGNSFLFQWSRPEIGDVVVFKFPENPDVFYVKRVVARGGDEISVHEGQITVNGQLYQQELIAEPHLLAEDESGFDYYRETGGSDAYTIRYRSKDFSFLNPVRVPEGFYFVMGDNRDQSNDSRVWGFVPEKNLVGSAQLIWLSCERTLPSAAFLCDPAAIRWDRLLKKLQ